MSEAIHAVAPQPLENSAPLDRQISPIAGRFGLRAEGKIATLVALAAGCGIFLTATWKHGPPPPRKTPIEPARQTVNFEPANTSPPNGPTLAQPGPNPPVLDPTLPQGPGGPVVPALQTAGSSGTPASVAATEAAARAKLDAIRSAPLVVFSQAAAQSKAPMAALVAGQAAESGPTDLDQLRRGSFIGLVKASRLSNQNFLITAGTSIPCTLMTAMDTATPGYVSCLIGQDLYSDNGAVVLLEKGSKVLGEYRSGMKQGQSRLFVLWTRAVTPSGVAVGLASPASDALGRGGFDGAIDTHFWARFGGALLLSIVDDASSNLAARSDPNGATLHVPSDAAAVALQNSVNIPPSLRKAQGSEVAIFVAQDLDFSAVYGLKAR